MSIPQLVVSFFWSITWTCPGNSRAYRLGLVLPVSEMLRSKKVLERRKTCVQYRSLSNTAWPKVAGSNPHVLYDAIEATSI